MRARRGLGLSAAAVAWLCFIPGAFAAGIANPNNQTNYSAQSVALTPGNRVTIFGTNLSYRVLGATGIPNNPPAVTVTFSAPTADTFANPGGAVCQWFGALTVTTPANVSGNTIVCTNPAAGGPFTFLQLTNPGGTGAITLTGPDVANLGNNIYPGLAPLSTATANQSAVVQIKAQATAGGAFTADATPIPVLALDSHNSFNLVTVPQTPLAIDLTGTGLPAIPPGAGFVTNAANGTRGVSTAGFLGSLWVTETQGDPDARTGLGCINGPTNSGNVNCASAITGTVTVTLTGDFATLTSAYLLPNNNGQPTASQANCTPTPPANSLAGTVNTTTHRSISFATFVTPANNQGASPQPVYAVCLVTNGTQVIQPTVTAPNGIQLVVSVAVPSITNPIVLTPAPTQTFGTIDYQGSVFFAQNVFGAADGAETFFRAVNRSNVPAQIWAVLTKDVINQASPTGAGSCTFPAGGGTAPITASCNTSFVANLTAASPAATGVITTNLASSAGLVQPNTGTYYTADDIAKLAGTTLPASSLTGTMYLLSPNGGVAFSALTQSTVFGVLVQTP